MSVWDNAALKTSGDYVKLAAPGDTVAGTITNVGLKRWEPDQNHPEGKLDPQITLITDGGEEKTLTAGTMRLKEVLIEERPEVGDHITVTLTRIEPRAGGKSMKHYDVKVVRGAGGVSAAPATAPATAATGVPAATPATTAPAAETAAVDPAVAAAALANLSPEERAALGFPAS